MADKLKSAWVYEVADTLNLTLAELTGPKLRGKRELTLDLGIIKLDIEFKVVSSSLWPDCYIVIGIAHGNLGFMVSVQDLQSIAQIQVHLINRSKVVHLTDWLERSKVKTVEGAVKDLGPAIVAGFTRQPDRSWVKTI